MRFWFFVVCALCNLSQPVAAIVLDVNLATKNAVYFKEIEERLQVVAKIQIGGTHVYGNRAVIKVKGKPTDTLNPQILIINPLRKQHAERDETVLSVVGDGFDFELLGRLRALLIKARARITLIYINNIENNLSLPTQFNRLREDVYSGLISVTPALHRQVDDALVRYVDAVTKGQSKNLYSLYFDMLQPGGTLLFKQAEQKELEVALKGIFSSYICQPCSIFSMFAEKERVLAASQRVLKTIGDGAYIPIKNSQGDKLSPADPYYKIKLQTRLLTNAGFEGCRTAIKKLKGWGWAGDVSETYSIVIHGTKP